jgi:hypothetical protein
MKTKSLVFALIFLTQTTSPAFAANVVYREEGESEVEYEAKKMADPSAVPFDEYQLDELVMTEQKEQLIVAYLTAQQAHLKNVQASNSKYWHEVILLAHKADWAKPHREMISTSYLRLSELAMTSKETEAVVREAVEFDTDFEPSPNDFTSRTIEIFTNHKKLLKYAELEPVMWHGYTYLVINGVAHPIDSDQKIKVSRGTKRFTWVSPTYKPVTQIANANKINGFSPTRLVAEHTSPRAMAPSLQTGLTQPSIENHFSFEKTEPVYKKTIFWVGVAAVVGGYMLYQSRQNEDSRYQPTKKVGF